MSGLVYTTERLGPNQSTTPEGFLLCKDTPIARTGIMLYSPDELPQVKAPKGAVIRARRSPEELFRPETVSSFEGKTVTNDHPDEEITAATNRKVDVGVILNVRQGLGMQDDLLLADLLIKDAAAIKDIRGGKREVSCDYDADYEDLGDGSAEQRNIIGHGVALVGAGRCGPRCAIGDKETITRKGKGQMAQSTLDRAFSRIRRAFRDKDADELEKAVDAARDAARDAAAEGEDPDGAASEKGGEHHIHVHLPGAGGAEEKPTEARAEDEEPEDDGDVHTRLKGLADQHEEMLSMLEELVHRVGGGSGEGVEDRRRDRAKDDNTKRMQSLWDKLRDSKRDKVKDGEKEDSKLEEDRTEDADPEELEREADEGMKDVARKTKDSMSFSDTYASTVALAEILAPGIRFKTFDAAANPSQTYKLMCGLRRRALDAASRAFDTKHLIDQVTNGHSDKIMTMSCDALRPIFFAAASLKRANNVSATRDVRGAPPGRSVGQSIASIAELNKRNAEFYSNK